MEPRSLESSPGLELLRGKVNEVRPSLIPMSMIPFPKDFHVQKKKTAARIFKDVAYFRDMDII